MAKASVLSPAQTPPVIKETGIGIGVNGDNGVSVGVVLGVSAGGTDALVGVGGTVGASIGSGVSVGVVVGVSVSRTDVFVGVGVIGGVSVGVGMFVGVGVGRAGR